MKEQAEKERYRTFVILQEKDNLINEQDNKLCSGSFGYTQINCY
ncbi:hypothetical protein MHK_002858 [Candidatus Magnetomorum sp. HK-1]|nr:hypothetical protein MHK_002858 [Candidatus Magnetomorum sp. HK-1]